MAGQAQSCKNPSHTLFSLPYTSKKTHQRIPVTLSLFNSPLQTSAEATFLGLTLTPTLTWRPQFEKMECKAWPRVNALKRLSALQNGRHPEIMVSLYSAFVRPIFEYGAIAFANSPQVHWLKLHRIQSLALKSFLQLPTYLSSEIAQDVASFPEIKNHLIDFSKRRLNSMKKSSPLIRNLIADHAAQLRRNAHKSSLEVLLA